MLTVSRLRFAVVLLLVAAAVSGCQGLRGERIVLIDGERGLGNFARSGDANWRAEAGAIVADRGSGMGGYLVTRESYADFELRAEFFAEAATNSGIFLRLSDPANITPMHGYEVNIYDDRPGPEYGTGAIVGFARAPVPNPHKAGGRWNVLEIRAEGPRITVRLNGVQTVQLRDGRFSAGPVALQFGNGFDGRPGGPIRWRRLEIRRL
ncbi:MAG: DUF1080 domain-containing protein [Burkholderiales bacterium]|nr:DUF1080 domain-containing protein [Burkholderiales bacterium]